MTIAYHTRHDRPMNSHHPSHHHHHHDPYTTITTTTIIIIILYMSSNIVEDSISYRQIAPETLLVVRELNDEGAFERILEIFGEHKGHKVAHM